jgi:tyrosine-protein kinase Etk/Wzc
VSTSNYVINKDFNVSIARVVLRRNWLIALAAILLMSLFAFLYLRYTKPLYESRIVIQLGEKDKGKELLEIENINTKDNISSELELLRSELLFDFALEKLNLNVSVFSKGKFLTEEKYHQSTFTVLPYELIDSNLCAIPIYLQAKNNQIEVHYELYGKKFVFNSPKNKRLKTPHFDVTIKTSSWNNFLADDNANELYFTFNNRKELVKRLLPNLVVEPVDAQAKTIEIKYIGNNAEFCHDITQSVAAAFFTYDEDMKRKSSENILNFLEQQIDSIAGELQLSKDSLSQYQRTTQLTDPEMSGNKLTENIGLYQGQLFVIQDELATLNLVKTKLSNDPNRVEIYRLIPEMLGKSFELSLTKQINDLNLLLERKEELLTTVNENHAEIKNIQSKLVFKIQNIRRSVDVIYERLQKSAQLIRSKIGGFEGEYMALPDKKMEFNRLKSLQNLNDKYFTLLTEKKILYSISNAGYTSNNRVLNQATFSNDPISPNKNKTYGIFIFVGFILAISFLVIKYLTYNEITTIDDLKLLLHQNAIILGTIPELKNKVGHSQLVVHNSAKSILAEALRTIRTNISFINSHAKTIAISSSISGEGKTFVALNLAGILALSDKKIVLLDLDLRKPKVHLGLGKQNDAGISNAIIGDVSLNEIIQQTEIENLDFISAGSIPPNPSELILSDAFNAILNELKNRYDIVVIDSPPVGIVTDGVQVLSESDIPIYVFRSNFSKRIFAKKINDLYQLKQIKNINVILNNVSISKSEFGYGYGYYEEEKN